MKKNLHNIIYHLSKKSREEKTILNAPYKKIFLSIYWLYKKEVTVSKAVSLICVMEKLGVHGISFLEKRSPATLRKIALQLREIIKEKLVAKIKESHVHACFRVSGMK